MTIPGGFFEAAEVLGKYPEVEVGLHVTLTYRPRCGRPRKLLASTVESEILPLVDDPSKAGQLHWTVVKLSSWLKQEKPFYISYRTLVRYLHEHRYARRIPRPMPEPPDKDKWTQQRDDCATRLTALLVDPTARVFFSDEAGFEGDPRPRHKWVKRGSRPTQASRFPQGPTG